MSGDTSLSSDSLRAQLTSFWNGALEVEPTVRGLVFTMPVSYPDGWQVVLEISQKTPGAYYLSDRGKTLAWLGGQGLNFETDAVDRRKRLVLFYRPSALARLADDRGRTPRAVRGELVVG